MKKLFLLLAFAVLLLVASCGRTQNENDLEDENRYVQEYEETSEESAETVNIPPEEPVTVPEQSPELDVEPFMDFAIAANYFARLNAVWDADNGALWGVPLHAPVAFFCADTRVAVANQPLGRNTTRHYVGDMAIYTGSLTPGASDDVMVQDMHMQTWVTINVNDLGNFYREDEYMLTQFAFWAVQLQIFDFVGLGGGVRNDTSEKTQVYSILEMAALVAAWESYGSERVQAINDALYFRNSRRQNFSDNLIALERGGERGSGLSDIIYTMKARPERLGLQLEALGKSAHGYGFFYYDPPRYPTDIDEVQPTDVEALIAKFRGSGIYDRVVFDTHSGLSLRNKTLMELADNIFIVSRHSAAGHKKLIMFKGQIDGCFNEQSADLYKRCHILLNHTSKHSGGHDESMAYNTAASDFTDMFSAKVSMLPFSEDVSDEYAPEALAGMSNGFGAAIAEIARRV